MCLDTPIVVSVTLWSKTDTQSDTGLCDSRSGNSKNVT